MASATVLLIWLSAADSARSQGCFNPPWPDGCSLQYVPLFVQNGLNWIFLNACNYHDFCWSQVNAPYSPCLGFGHKVWCDAIFLATMDAACIFWSGVLSYPGSGWVDASDFRDDCFTISYLFWTAVNTSWGWLIFTGNQCDCGCNIDMCFPPRNPLGWWCIPPYCGSGGGGGGPGPCSMTLEQTHVVAIELETGRLLYPEGIVTRGLTRTAEAGGERFFLEEWQLRRVDTPAVATTLAASSPRAQMSSQRYGSALLATPGVQPGRHYLVVEAARHMNGLIEPLVMLESLRTGKPAARNLPDGRVVFRASFSPHGLLENVQVIEGPARVARTLARDLRVGGAVSLEQDHDRSGGHHRSVVYAIFNVVGGEPFFVSAFTALPQCCEGPPIEY